jgi:hypothetical protein
MKVFWSWQSDTPGRIGRHFVRAVLTDAIMVLKQPEDVEEPSEREAREALHLDHDRQGVAGSPDLAPTIFGKIDRSAVFVVDVTLVADQLVATDGPAARPKKLINSNVAIEYGYALRALGDEFILMVQNAHYGDRDELPFDLKHKAGPIQYRLAPNATKAEIAAEHAKLRSVFVDALKPYIGRTNAAGTAAPRFVETPSTTNIACFWKPSDVLASQGSAISRVLGRADEEDRIEHRFNEQHVFYLRLIPTTPLRDALSVTALMDVAERRTLHVLTRTINGGMSGRNGFGAIIYESHGTSTVPLAFTQLFRNGEIWGVSREFAAHHEGALVVPMVNVQNIFGRTLATFVRTAHEGLGVVPPYQIELGAVGLKDMCVSLPPPMASWPNQVSDRIYEDQLRLRRVLNDLHPAAQNALLAEFLVRLYDLAGVKAA